MKTKIKIIRHFLKDKTPKTIRQIAQAINSDYRITYTAIQKLEEQSIIQIQTVGKSSLCQFNEGIFNQEIFQAEYERKESLLKNKNIDQLFKEIQSKINSSFFIMLIFGSYASNQQSKNSDIDLMFISNEKDFEKKADDILALMPLKTHALVFTEEEFIRMKNSKKSNVILEAQKNYILLYGIETYYQLKNA